MLSLQKIQIKPISIRSQIILKIIAADSQILDKKD